MKPPNDSNPSTHDYDRGEKALENRLERSRLALDKKKELAAKLLQRRSKPAPSSRKVKQSPPPASPHTVPLTTVASTKCWEKVRLAQPHLDFWSRTTNEQVWPQPWTKALTNAMLEAADVGGIRLCLAWPVKLTSLPLVHALANVERLFATDMRGLRTLMFPGTHATRACLQSTLVNRIQLTDLYRQLWVKDGGKTIIATSTKSPSMVAALSALNDVRNWQPEVSNPSIAELIPAFVFHDPNVGWTSPAQFPLERTLSKVTKYGHRNKLREQVKAEWGVASKAPCALMVLHHSTKKDTWKQALKASGLRADARPDALLLDATAAAAQSNFNAVKRIPDFLRVTREQGLNDVGVVVVTDDPKTFFILRAQLHEFKLDFTCQVWTAEHQHGLLSPEPRSDDWKPDMRSNSNFSVGIVDRDASQVALAFQKLAQSAGGEDSRGHRALMEACVYVLRLSNTPAGYSDLTQQMAEEETASFASQRNAWTTVSLAIYEELAAGTLNSFRAQVDAVLRKAESLIDSWNDATPMAARLLAEVQRYACNGTNALSVVLPNSHYILLAHRYLKRKLGAQWGEIENNVEWHTLASVGKILAGERKDQHFVFVGINADVLRILLAHPGVPHGTAVLVAYKQAESTLATLTGMKTVDAFKSYRGRIGLLMQELERRLAEVPNPLLINKLKDMSLTFRLGDVDSPGSAEEQSYFKFELEGGGRAYASGWVYRYMPDEDPFFRRTPASTIAEGDFIFDMSDELRAELESSFHLDGEGTSSVVNPVRMLLKLYHTDVQNRCSLMFRSTKRSALACEIHAKMVEIDPKAAECRQGRVYYWLALQAEGDTRPHAARDAKFFKVFCKALGISDENAEQHWSFIRNARRLNQYLGRELVARYAEILFQPESAVIYRKVPKSVIKHLQQEALRWVYRVERVVPPAARTVTDQKG